MPPPCRATAWPLHSDKLASMQTFRSKIDSWILVVAFLPMIVAVVLVAVNTHGDPRPMAMVLAVLVVIGLGIGSMFRNTYYQLREGELLIRSGFFRWRVVIASIESITPTHNPLSSPALSLDRLAIRYRKNGRDALILVSPLDKSGFIAALRAANPAIGI